MNKKEPKKRLLIIGCSNRKAQRNGFMKAWDRYQGGCFPLLKELEARSELPKDLDILIISAKYGLLHPCDLIEWYDLKMSPARAETLKAPILNALVLQLQSVAYSTTLILLEPSYMNCVESIAFPEPLYLHAVNDENLCFLKHWVLTAEHIEQA